MKKFGLILGFMSVILLGIFIWSVLTTDQILQQETRDSLSGQSSDQGEVVVEAEPLDLESGKQTKFKVTMDTHSVELDYDLMKVSSLVNDQGNTLKPLSWNGGSGGHHLKGELTFPALEQKSKSVELLMANISGFDRRFKWNL